MADLAVNHLRRDFQDARKFLAQLSSLLDSLSVNHQWTAEQGESMRHIARFFEENLSLLIRKEDKILYPALEGLFPGDSGPLSLLRGELRDLGSSLQQACEIGRSLNEEANPPETFGEFQRFGRKATEVLQDHLYKEERVLFPMAAGYLSPERDAELVQKMESLDLAGGQRATTDQLPSSD